MNPRQAEENYARWCNRDRSERIDGALNNTATARLGVAFNYTTGEEIAAIELSFTSEPYGNVRSTMVVDLTAAHVLRDQLDAAIRAHVEGGK